MSDGQVGYVLFVDEAGDDGLKSLQPENPSGSSEWLVLAGYLVRAENSSKLPALVRAIRAEIGATQARTLHYKDLSQTKRRQACVLLAREPGRAFAICSFKRSLLGYQNQRAAKAGQAQWYYNFLVRLLLERTTDFVSAHAAANPGRPSLLRVVFSARGGHRYGQLKAYLQQLRYQAVAGTTYLGKRVIHPDVLRHDLMEYVPHHMEAGLQLADIVASSAYQALVPYSARWDLEPVKSLKPIIAREPKPVFDDGAQHDYGFVLVPAPLKANLSPDQQLIFRCFGYSFI